MQKPIKTLMTSITLAGMLILSGNISATVATEVLTRDQNTLISQIPSRIKLTDIEGFGGVIVSLGVTPDGQTMIVGSNDGYITAIDLNTLKPVYSKFKITNPYSNISFNSDGSLFAIPSEKGIVVYETKTGRIINTLQGHSGNISSLTISPDDRVLISASGEDLTFKVWDLANGTLLKDVSQDVSSVTSVAFSPNGQYFVTGAGGIGSDRSVKLWDAQNYQLIQTLPKQFGFIYDLAFNSDGDMLVGAVKNYVKVWDLNNNNTELLSLRASPLDINKVAISPNNRLIATANREGSIQIIDLNQRKIVTSLKGHQGWVQSLTFSPDGKTLYSGAEDKMIKVWDLSEF